MCSKGKETMMTNFLLKKTNIKPLLAECAKQWQVYRPKDDVMISPKKAFFPQLELLFTVENSQIEYDTAHTKQLLFGIRPCDFNAMLLVDKFFSGKFKDTYYLNQIKNRLIIVEGCIAPPRPETCFCTSAKTGPFLKSGYDLQLVKIDDEAFIVEVGSSKGEKFVAKYQRFFQQIANNKSKISAIKQQAKNAVKLKVDFDKALKLMRSIIPKQIYEEIAQRCIDCGGCLYVCPTCTCFNIFDDGENDRYKRYRNWDACVFSGYSKEAGGYNPREARWLRAARRYEHKLRDDYKVYQASTCVGCGRCLSTCPVNLGMSKFIQAITTEEK